MCGGGDGLPRTLKPVFNLAPSHNDAAATSPPPPPSKQAHIFGYRERGGGGVAAQ